MAIFALVGFGVAAITRLLVLPLSVIDWDESVYLLVSRDILNGAFPYQGGFDHKPVALYYTFALAQLLFGQGVLAIRLLAILAVGLTAFLIAVFLRRAAAADNLTAAAAGAVYALVSTLNGGLATNTEILLNVYAAAALILIAGSGMTDAFVPRRALAIGAVVGLMLNTNYLAGPPFAGLAAAYAYGVWRRHGLRRSAILCLANGGVGVAALCATTAVLLLPIALWSDLGDYFAQQASYLAVYRRDTDTLEYARRIFRALESYAPLVALAVTLVLLLGASKAFRRAASERDGIVAGQTLLYLAFALSAALASGRIFPHYFILALPGLCILAGLFLTRVPAAHALRQACVLWLLLLSAASLVLQRQDFHPGWNGTLKWLAGEPPDLPAAIAGNLRGRLAAGDRVYVYDYEPILYALLDTPLPLQRFYPPHHLRPIYGMDRVVAIESVMAQAPRFVIAGSDPRDGRHDIASARLSEALDRDYTLLHGYPARGRAVVRIYERRPAVAGTGAAR